MATFDYDDLFAGQRVVVFSLPNIQTACSQAHFLNFSENYNQFLTNGIDNMYVVNSTDWLIGPYVDKRSSDLKGLPDRNMEFVNAVANHVNNKNDVNDLARFWQYLIIINDGEPEKFWSAPFKKETSLSILKSRKIRYHGLSTDNVLKYLIDNSK